MKVYFVRHGESEFNKKNIHQHSGVELTQHGAYQAEIVAKRLSEIKFDHMFSSTYERAKQTAEIISRRVNKEIEFSDKIVELVRPSELVGLNYSDPVALSIKDKIRESSSDSKWHYSDEENFFDFKDRALAFIQELENRFYNETILVVTHGHYMRMLVAVMHNMDIDPHLFYRYESFFMTRNTGITLCEKRRDKAWRLLTWNDHAHLNEPVKNFV